MSDRASGAPSSPPTGFGAPLPPPRAPSPRRRPSGRPAFVLVVVVTFGWRFGRDLLDRYVVGQFGWIGFIVLLACGAAVVAGWNLWRRHTIARRGTEFTPESVMRQLADAGMTEPSFEEDGTLRGASLLVVNQRAKVIEVNTAYDVFGRDGALLGSVTQIRQSRGKTIARLITPLDQYFTHHFAITDNDGRLLLRLTRPRKVFRSTVHVFDAEEVYLGALAQENVFGKIRFGIHDAMGTTIATLRAEQWRAWDFRVVDTWQGDLAWIVKTWEGWAHTAFTRADRYAVRIERPLAEPLRSLTLAAALVVDLALKQDARGVG